MKRRAVAVSTLYEKDFFHQYKFLSQDKPYHSILESGNGGRYSIVGLDPIAILRGKHNELHIIEGDKQTVIKGNPIDEMKRYMKRYETIQGDNFPPFQGGAIGYFSYDCIRYIETIPQTAKDDLDVPDILFLLFDDVVVYDHCEKVLWCITHFTTDEKGAELHVREMMQIWMADYPAIHISAAKSLAEATVSLTEEGFCNAVAAIKEYIAAGDVFQVNLSVRQSQPLCSHPLEIYTKLREINPSPYMGYIELSDFQVVCGSPELLIRKRGLEVSTRPIAGTRSRGKDDREDQALEKELIENEKERAEHVMLVDLERNDLGRVCKYGTVRVDEFMTIERYSHVMHIVSNVCGELEEEKDAFDVMKAVFPGGTITGAPKIRTMEIIEELEPVRRSLYTGSIGWIDFSGDMELNIVIRTLLAKDGQAYVQAGAGIVIDSNPKNEYKESLKKATALWRAKEISEES
ncbi:anthranilate synthase component I family protein [Ectobacillus polymachus]|uniref:anthranilate synthase component I family protein n=1 Tax=Ectobacillus polymachus TaxID=1508806 RepID=UPI003A887A32